jgi:hypothetical protein
VQAYIVDEAALEVTVLTAVGEREGGARGGSAWD